MILRTFFNTPLAQASYLVGCAATGEAIVIDPLRDIQPYLEEAKREGLRITAITETHIHADYLSGSRELQAATGAKLFVSDEGDADWKYLFAYEPGVVLLKHGDRIHIGNLSFLVLHTPGHTPEHISFLLTDHPASETPHSLFSGDFVFVGDVGRPDLLERAANMEGTMVAGAKRLYRSLQDVKSLPDTLLVWPAHGAGSACGKSLGAVPVSSLGYEKLVNWGLRSPSEPEFVNDVLSNQPEPPRYFKEMKRLNKVGPAVLGSMPKPLRLPIDLLPDLLESKAQVLDTRAADHIRAGMIPNSLALPYGRSFVTWAGWLVNYEQPIWIIADDQQAANEAARDLSLIGLDHVKGWFPSDQLNHLPEESRGTPIPSSTFDDLSDEVEIVDVRGANEASRGMVPGAKSVPLGYLSDRILEFDRNVPLAVHCQSGGRSPIAVSVLRRLGHQNVIEIPSGYSGYLAQTCLKRSGG